MNITLRPQSPAAAPAASDEIIRERPNVFRVHTRAYTDSSVFQRELNRIFLKTWVYVGHESEIASPGDYKTSHIGMQPVIVSRGMDGSVNVLLNRCAHRAAVLCRQQRGNATSFTCPYHAWSYSIEGELTGITNRNDAGGYAEDFEAPKGLYRLPRIDSYRGFIFASFDENVVPLLDFLGRTKILIDRKLNQAPNGTITVRSRPYVGNYEGNWKFHAENIIDGYHFMFTHQSFVKLQQKFGDSTGDFGVHKGGSATEMKKLRTSGNVWGCAQGHIVNQKPAIGLDDLLNGEFAGYYQGLLEKYGREELNWLVGAGAACIFPTLGLIHNQIRTWRPIAPGMTEVRIFLYDLDGAPDAFNEGMLRSQERFYGPSGHGMPDDIEMFAVNQQGLGGSALDWLILERGMRDETPLGDGDVEGMPSSETGHRAFWRRWRAMVGGESETA